MFGRYHGDQERRKYIRLDSVFPVSFCLLSLDGQVISDWMQGFTSNISRGGICLYVNNLDPKWTDLLNKKQVKLSLSIEIPLHKDAVHAKATSVWIEAVSGQADKYIIGLAYEEISQVMNNRIFHYVLAKKFIPQLGLIMLVVLLVSISVSGYINLKLIRGNKVLIEQFVDILQKSGVAKQDIKKLAQEKEGLNLKLSAMEVRLKALEEEKQKIAEAEKSRLIREQEAKKKTDDLLGLIKQLETERSGLQEKLLSLQDKENKITENLLLLDKKKVDLEKTNLEKVYQWLKVHQNPRTGLVLSFEGDNELANWAFVYDQALAAIAYVNFSDFERAKKILDFFKLKAERVEKGFLNAYYVNDGDPAEYIVHSGPNIWLGIAIMHYIQKSQDRGYLPLAESIGNWVIGLQSQDKDGGMRGGPRVYWYSTEHNLDAYALLNMLYKITQQDKYLQAAQRTLNWLQLHVYDRPDVPIMRGKGDSTIATDTYAWSIAAIGPEKLEALGMNPDKIIEFSEETCSVETDYVRPSGEKIKVKGFDFAPVRHVGRGGVISCEWTAQMILAYKLMARFYYKKDMLVKARFYDFKADEYLTNLLKLVISSPSPSGLGEGCFPYATQDFVDTGHGWTTPKGKDTGSVAATAYALFAYYGNNPLEIAD